MYHPGSNYRITRELQERRSADIDRKRAEWLQRLRTQLMGATILDVDRGGEDGDSLVIRYSKSMTHFAGQIVIAGIDNDEKEW